MKISTKTMAQVALLVAVEVVLNRFLSINTTEVKIGFSFLPIALCGMLFGPVWAAVAGGLSDVVGATLFPIGTYHPGFTIVAALMGAVFGLFLRKKEGGRFVAGVACSMVINCLVLGLCVNTFWISQLYSSNTYWGFFMMRLTTQYIFLVPVYVICLMQLPRLVRAIDRSGLVSV